MDVAKLWNKIFDTIKASPRVLPSTIEIPRDHTDETLATFNESFKRDKHYFQVLINEMYLVNQREWFKKIDPVVYVVSEFTYNGKDQIVPKLVGPSLLKDEGVPDEYNKGVIIRNTAVSGLFPYRGGGLTLTVVLCESKTDDYARKLLRVVESTAQALDFSPVLTPYTKIAGAVMDGFEMLFSSGSITPLAGLRDSYGPNLNTAFRPTYFAQIDSANVDPATLWVRGKQLMQGKSLDASKPYRAGDFVLYSIIGPQDNARDDLETLPFNELWVKVKKGAASPIDKPNYEATKRDMSTLYEMIVASPDLTEDHGYAIADEYAGRMKTIHEKAVKLGAMDGDKTSAQERESVAALHKKSLALLRT